MRKTLSGFVVLVLVAGGLFTSRYSAAVSAASLAPAACMAAACPWQGPTRLVDSAGPVTGLPSKDSQTERLVIRVLDAPGAGAGDVVVSGPGVHERRLQGSVLRLTARSVSEWTVTALRVRANGDTYFPTTETTRVNLARGASGTVTVDYADVVSDATAVVDADAVVGMLPGSVPATIDGVVVPVPPTCRGPKVQSAIIDERTRNFFVAAKDVAAGINPRYTPDGLWWRVTCPPQEIGRSTLYRVWGSPAPLSDIPSGSIPNGDLHGLITVTRSPDTRHACASGVDLSLDAKLVFHPTWSLSVRWQGFSKDSFSAEAKLGGQATATLDASATAGPKCDWSTDLLPKPDRLDPVEVDIGPVPVVVTPVLTIPVDLSAHATAEASVDVSETLSTSAEVTWTGKKLITSWSPPRPGVSTPPTESLNGSAEVTATIGPSIEFELYGYAGPTADLEGVAQLTGNSSGYSVCAGVQGGISLDFHLFAPFDAEVKVGDDSDLFQHLWQIAGNEDCSGGPLVSWAIHPVSGPPGSTLDGVSCASASACEAVGLSPTGVFAEGWNGKTWATQELPSPPDDLGEEQVLGVSCPAANYCMAVGTYDYGVNGTSEANPTLIEVWNGHQWSVQASPSPGTPGKIDDTLTSVSCPAVKRCIVVGTYAAFPFPINTNFAVPDPFSDQLDGTTWSTQKAPIPSGEQGADPQSVSCATPTACVAVGDGVQASANSEGGGSVCIGCSTPPTMVWNGTRWTETAPPAEPDASSGDFGLTSVSCVAANSCESVGDDFTGNGRWNMYSEHWNGTSWASTVIPDDVLLGALSCATVDACVAVGTVGEGAGSPAASEIWDGTAWYASSTPSTSGYNQLSAVSCTTGYNCTAVGWSQDEAGSDSPLAEST